MTHFSRKITIIHTDCFIFLFEINKYLGKLH